MEPTAQNEPSQPEKATQAAALGHSHAFFVAWAAATLFHQLGFRRVAATPLDAALSLTALVVLARPSRTGTFALLLGLQVVEVWSRAPVVSNHWWTTMFAATAMLGALPFAIRRGFDAVSWRRAFEPVLRGVLVVVYIWGVLHKVNRDFLDPQISCGAELYTALREDFLPFLPQGTVMGWMAITITFAVEAAIPILLLIPRTRSWGILLGTSFHFMLGFVPYSVYYNFSSMLFALYFLYTREGWVERWLTPWRERLSEKTRRRARLAIILTVAGFCAASAIYGGAHRSTWRFAPRVPWLLYGATLIVAYAKHRSGAGARLVRGPWPRPLGLLVLVYLLNGASPYFGLKTETSLAMYSNLRTEGGRNNHLWLSNRFDLLGLQSDVAVVHSTSDRWLRRKTKSDYGMVWYELVDRLARRPATRIDFERDGRRERLERAGDDPRFAHRAPWWMRKLVYFRPVDLRERQRCIH